MNTELAEARKAQRDAIYNNDYPSLEADYALLEATQRAIEAQTEVCPECEGDGYICYDDYNIFDEECPTCKGRGRVRKDGV